MNREYYEMRKGGKEWEGWKGIGRGEVDRVQKPVCWLSNLWEGIGIIF